MQIVELYTTEECGLCKQVKELLKQRQKTIPFELREITLTPGHALYEKYVLAVPVVIVDGKHELKAVTTEEQLTAVIKPARAPTRLFYVAKFLEALGMVTVVFGFVYGLKGDMWTDLYFFLTGILIFAAGRVMEKREQKRQSENNGSDTSPQPAEPTAPPRATSRK